MRTIHLQAVTPSDLSERVPGITLAEARKVVSAVHRAGTPEAARGVRRKALDAVVAASTLPALGLREARRSSRDPFIKYAFDTRDGGLVESVRIPLERPGRFSVCVSSQAGCALGCTFCATGRAGLLRNLEAWEIVEQVREVRRRLDPGARVHGIVFQGMGEPLANLDSVVQAVRVACDPSAMAVDGRAITVCTAGLPPGIRRLAAELPKVRLGISIGSAHPDVRRALMPIDRAHPLEEVLEAAGDHARRTRIAPMWAVTLLAGVNDGRQEAEALARLALTFTRKHGVRPRISIVPYNAIDAAERDPFRRTPREAEAAFRAVLHAAGLPTHLRYSGGGDMAAACGQLAVRATPA